MAGSWRSWPFRSDPPERTYQSSVDETFAASVSPIANETNDTGERACLDARRSGLQARPADARCDPRLDGRDAEPAVGQFETLTAPADLTGAASSCLSALAQCARVLGALPLHRWRRSSLVGDRSGGRRTPRRQQAEASIEHLGSSLAGADESWSDAEHDARGARQERNSVPESSWVGDPARLAESLGRQLHRRPDRSRPRTFQRHLCRSSAVSGEPPAVVTVHGVDELPDDQLPVAARRRGGHATHGGAGVVATISLTPPGATGKPDS